MSYQVSIAAGESLLVDASFGNHNGYKCFCISDNNEGKMCLCAFEWNKASIIWESDSYFSSRISLSVSGQRFTITNNISEAITLNIF